MISIVTGTRNRIQHLQKMVESVRESAKNLKYEIIVVDCQSTDGTAVWCSQQKDIVFLDQGETRGAVAAFNQGFREACFGYVCNLNDDVILHGCLEDAIELLENDSTIGQVALPSTDKWNPNNPHIYYTLPIAGRQWVYANFAVTRRELGERLGWWGDKYFHYAGDAELSMRIWKEGFRVAILAGGGYIEHLELDDATRRPNTDSDKFYEEWSKWDGE